MALIFAVRHDNFARSDFDQPQAGPKGGGQDTRSNTPCNLVRFTLGLETSAASLVIKSSGSNTTCVAPSL
jgi:hypothetical protein